MAVWTKNEPRKAHIEKQPGTSNVWLIKDENGFVLATHTSSYDCEAWLEAAGYEREDE